jgi:hypothetical protein
MRPGQKRVMAASSFGSGDPTDPFFANVAALFHFNDTPGSTTFVDSSNNHNNGTRAGPATTSVTQSVFGGISFFSSTQAANAFLAANIAPYIIGTNDFTLEFRYWCGELSTTRFWFSLANSAAVGNQINMFLWGDGRVTLRNTVDNPDSAVGVMVLNQWAAWCIERAAGTTRVYKNGTPVITVADAVNYNVAAAIRFPGFTTGALNNYYDEFRFTNGVARYQGAYTVAGAPFPNK